MRPTETLIKLHGEVYRLASEMGPGHGLCAGCEIFYRKLMTVLDKHPVPPELNSNVALGDLLEGIQVNVVVDGQEIIIKESGAVCVFGDGETETNIAGLRRMVKVSGATIKLIKALRTELGGKDDA